MMSVNAAVSGQDNGQPAIPPGHSWFMVKDNIIEIQSSHVVIERDLQLNLKEFQYSFR